MLVARRRAPGGGRCADTQRAAGVFAVIGTATAVLVAFVILVAFQSYDRARQAAHAEAQATADLYEPAHLFPEPGRTRIKADLISYGRPAAADAGRPMPARDEALR